MTGLILEIGHAGGGLGEMMLGGDSVYVAKNSICVAKNSISDCVWHVRRQVVNMLNKFNVCKDTRLCRVTKHCKDSK